MRTLHAKVSVFSIRPMDAGCPIPRKRGDCFVGVPSQAQDKPRSNTLSNSVRWLKKRGILKKNADRVSCSNIHILINSVSTFSS